MTSSSRWKSAQVGIIGHDTIHNSFSQDLLQAPWVIMGVTQGFVKEQTYEAPWEIPGSHFWEPLSKASDHRSRALLSGRSHQLISREPGGSMPCCLKLAKIQIVAYTFCSKRKKEKWKTLRSICFIKPQVRCFLCNVPAWRWGGDHCGLWRNCGEHCPREVPTDPAGGRRQGLGKTWPCLEFLVSDGHSRNSICAGFSDLWVPALCQVLC